MLQQATKPQPRIDWSSLYFTAAAENEQFTDVQIVTAKSEYDRIVGELSFDRSLANPFTLPDIPSVEVREAVTIDEHGGFRVIIHADAVSDDVMWKALDMVADAMFHLDGNSGTIYFSDAISFKRG